MFNLQGSEVIIILLLALVVLGPEKLPDAMRKAGQFYAELKKMSTGFQTEFRSAIEEPLRELRDTANTIRDSADFTKLQNGEREEKPKSADMLAPADPSAVPTDDLPFGPAAATDAPDDGDGDGDGDDDAPVDRVDPVVDDPQNQVPFSSVVISNPTPQRKHAAFTQTSSAAPSSAASGDEPEVAEADADAGSPNDVPAASTPPSGGDDAATDPNDAATDPNDAATDPNDAATAEPAEDAVAEQPG